MMNTALFVMFCITCVCSGVFLTTIGKPRKPLTVGLWFFTELVNWSLLIWVILTNGGF